MSEFEVMKHYPSSLILQMVCSKVFTLGQAAQHPVLGANYLPTLFRNNNYDA